MIMKYLFGFSVLSSPISHSLSAMEPEYHDGYRMAGDLASPNVLYAIQAPGSFSPHCSLKSPRWYF